MNKKEAVDYIQKSIKGALFKAEGELLYDMARHCVGKGIIVEIGSLLGKSTAYLGFGSKAGVSVKIYTIDPFDGGDLIPCAAHIKDIVAKGDFFPEFRANMKRAGLSDIIIAIPKRSVDAVPLIREPIELIFIDGAHGYEFVKSDFLNYFPKVIYGGTIAFHDRGISGVKQVINEYVTSNTEVEQIKTCKTILYCKKKQKE